MRCSSLVITSKLRFTVSGHSERHDSQTARRRRDSEVLQSLVERSGQSEVRSGGQEKGPGSRAGLREHRRRVRYTRRGIGSLHGGRGLRIHHQDPSTQRTTGQKSNRTIDTRCAPSRSPCVTKCSVTCASPSPTSRRHAGERTNPTKCRRRMSPTNRIVPSDGTSWRRQSNRTWDSVVAVIIDSIGQMYMDRERKQTRF